MIIGIWIDLVQISRFDSLIDICQEKIINTIYTEQEHSYCSKHKYSSQHFAATFAVKEALIKAFGRSTLRLKEIECVRNDYGKPIVQLHGSTKEMIRSYGVEIIHVTITHDAEYSVAVVILEKM